MIEKLTENIQEAYNNDALTDEQYNGMMNIVQENAVADSLKVVDECLSKLKDAISKIKSNIPKGDVDKKKIQQELEKRENKLKNVVITTSQITNKEPIKLSDDPKDATTVRADLIQKTGKTISSDKYNESTGLDKISDAIFEAYKDNKITKEQKNMLLSKLVEAYE